MRFIKRIFYTADGQPRNIIPRSRTGQFFFFAAETFIAYFTIVANTRAFTQGSYQWTIITDGFYTLQGGIIGKLAIENKDARTWFAIAGSVIGGMLGSCASIWCTKHLYGA